MSTYISSGTSLSSDYFLRSFYKNNRDVIKSSARNDFSNVELSFEDSRALSRAAKSLRLNDYSSVNTDYSSYDDDYEENDDLSDTTKATIEAFVDTYNNAIESGNESDDHDTERYIKQLKNLTKKYSDELEEIGISIENDGTLTIDDELLSLADNDKLDNLFSYEQEYPRRVISLASKINTAAQNDIYSQITTKGLHVNISI
jgi:membrane-associated HD superfamily phosphohydrolase